MKHIIIYWTSSGHNHCNCGYRVDSLRTKQHMHDLENSRTWRSQRIKHRIFEVPESFIVDIDMQHLLWDTYYNELSLIRAILDDVITSSAMLLLDRMTSCSISGKEVYSCREYLRYTSKQ